MRLVLVLVGALLAVNGCIATKTYVRGEVGKTEQQIEEVKHRVERLETDLQQAQDRLTALDTQVVKAHTVAEEAAQLADQASNAAGAAMAKAEDAAQPLATAKPGGPRAVRNGGSPAETITVLFGFARSQLDARAQAALVTAAKRAQWDRKLLVYLEGHSDNVGSNIENLQISQQRAEAVRRFLLNQGIGVDRIRIVAYGDSKPVADNRSRLGRDQNRRVTVKLVAAGR